MKTFIEFLSEAPRRKPTAIAKIVKPRAPKGAVTKGTALFDGLPVNQHHEAIHANRLTPETMPDAKRRKDLETIIWRYENHPGNVSTAVPGSASLSGPAVPTINAFKELYHNPALHVPKSLGPMTLYHGTRAEPQFDENGHIFLGNKAAVSTATTPHKALSATREDKYVGKTPMDTHHVIVIHHPNNDDHHAVSIMNMGKKRTEDEVILPPGVFKLIGNDYQAEPHPTTGLPVMVHHVEPVMPHPSFMKDAHFKRMYAQHGHLLGKDANSDWRLKTQLPPEEKKKK